MDLVLRWWILLSCLIKQVHLESHLSKQEVALLAVDEDPKCFTRDLENFTCFWEAPVGKSYYFLYIIDSSTEEKRCDVKQQIYDKKDLHICTFPSSDVFLFVDTDLRVIDRDTNTTVYSRTVNVENQLLLYPPSNISLHPTGEVGQLLVKWKRQNNAVNSQLQYEIRYSSKNTSSTVGQVSKHQHKLVSLVAGENCTVQMRVKPMGDSNLLWSDWSSPVTAMVPQTAGDIELQCHTPDLSQVLCKWRGELYDDGSFYYRRLNRSSWGIWKLCSKDNNTVHQCVLNGQESSVYQFYLSAGLQPYGQTFYAKTFSMNSNIKTGPPGGLKAKPEEGRLCLTWDPSFLKISQYLKYQIRYQHKAESEWKDFTTPSSKTSTCLDVHRGSQYTIQVRAQPNGSVYSGDWSDWSKPLTVLLPLDKEWIFILCIPVTLLIIASAMISFFSRYIRSSWGIWKLCSKDNNTVHQCVLNGQESSVYQFYLSAGLQPYGQTFYAKTFSMNSNIKTGPPGGLKAKPEEGRLCLTWDPSFLKISQYLKYQIRYQHKAESEWKDFTTPSSKTSTCLDVHRGSQYTIQVRAQPNGSVYSGDWSDWSKPLTVLLPLDKEWIFILCIPVTLLIIATAMISFFSRYIRSSWGIWKLCSKDNNTVHQCVLNGQESSVYQFYLSAGLQPYGQTFYAKTFSMNSNIKTGPPGGLKAKPEEGRLCLTWDPSFLKISQYLKYQIRYQHKAESEWKDFTTPSSKTSTCLDVHRGSQYTIQVRAQPNGSVYSGDWSDWSKPLTVLLPLDKEWIFILCIPVTLLIIATAMISFFSRYIRKVKKSLWPSVPNLNKMLESFLTDISGSHWEPTFNIKQCDDDTTTSVVEILPEKEAMVKPCKKSTCLSLSEHGFVSDEKNGENVRDNVLEMAQDYVILNNDKIPCCTGNDYVALSHVSNEKLNCCPSTFCTNFSECTTNILNHSYLLLAEKSELKKYHSACRQYTNMEITAIP